MLFTTYNALVNFINKIKNLYHRLCNTQNELKEYYLKLDGYFYSKSQYCNMAVIRIRNKRTTDIIPIRELVTDKKYLQELHPMDACIIGLLANNERNGLRNEKCIGWQKMHRFKDILCCTKSEPLLEVSKTYIKTDGTDMTVLRTKHFTKQIEIPTIELLKNQALMYGLDNFQAIAIGYGISEYIIRKNLTIY